MEAFEAVKIALRDEDPDDEIIDYCLFIAESAILNRRYPFGYPENVTLDPRYRSLQVEAAIALYNKMGVEGQIVHSENGISRTWGITDVPQGLLNEIVPVSRVRR